MPTADEQVIVEGQRAIAVTEVSGDYIYDGGATDIQCVVKSGDKAQRAIKVVNVGGGIPPAQEYAYMVQQLMMNKYQTQTTVDANDLVRNTASLNPFVLDLSENTVLTKLTATGTSEKVETGLTGVIVSPQAPLDNVTSPQIDVSYTGLNKAALVNLFKSMPYNVGYKVVGSPTIVDGVVSGFSSSDYLQTSTDIPYTSIVTLEEQLSFTTGTVGTQQMPLGADYGAGTFGFEISSNSNNNHILYRVTYYKTDDTLRYLDLSTSYNLSSNTKYIVSGTVNITTQSVSLTLLNSSGTVLDSVSSSLTAFSRLHAAGQILLGRHFQRGVFTGSIDLNETYIKVNGVPWFTGKAAMTKTVSVVGCSGTADLTAEDKAIAEDKGWAITLS